MHTIDQAEEKKNFEQWRRMQNVRMRILNEKFIFCKENNLFFTYVMSQSKTSLQILIIHIENSPNYF